MRLSRIGAGLLTACLLLAGAAGCGDAGGRTAEGARESGAAPGSPPATAEATRGPGAGSSWRGLVVTAECTLGARYGGIVVTAWNPHTWKQVEQRIFGISGSIVFSRGLATEVPLSPLFDLCRQNPYEAIYQSDALERVVPRVRALFDRDFTRMAVVIRDPDGSGTRVGYIEYDDEGMDGIALTEGNGREGPVPREENAVFAPDGKRVWFTYRTPDGRHRIGSRSVSGDHSLRDEGPATDRNLPLVVVGGPPRGIQAEMVHVSPDGRRMTARTSGSEKILFDFPATSTALTAATAKGARTLGECYHAVDWTGPDTVLCRTKAGEFRAFGTGTGAAPGPVLESVSARGNEGLVVSPDGNRFIVVKHPPGDPYDGFQGFYEAGTAPGSPVRKLEDDALNGHTLFLEWR